MRKSFNLLSFCGVILLMLISLESFAQRETPPSRQSTKKDPSKKTTEDYKMKAYGITTNTVGGVIGGFVFRSSKAIGSWHDKQMNRYFSIEAVNIKHAKEKTETSNQGSRIIFDKENYFLSVRPQYGREIMFFKKYGEEGVGVSGIIAGGPSIGIEKPYYIKYASGNGPNAAQQAQSVASDPAVHTDFNRIVGTGSLLEGIGYSKIIPGVNLKVAVNLDVNTFGNNLTGFEIGFLAEWFTRTPQIMAFAENQQLFTSAYLTLYFGSKK